MEKEMTKHVHGGNVYTYRGCLDFSANCNPLGTPESVKRAVIGSLDRIGDYPQVGYAPLREALGEYEGVSPEQVICGNGAAELIFSLCRAEKPRRALLAVPTFAEYEQALLSVDCRVEHFYLKREEGFALTEDFLEALRAPLDMVFLCNPNNPTGRLIDPGLLLRILERCREEHIFLVVDECFLDFVRDPEIHTLKGKLEEYGSLFLLKAFTKRYSMAGLRLGYGLCGNPQVLSGMEMATQPWNVSCLAQAAGIAALEEKEYVEQGRRIVFREAEYLTEELEKLGLSVYPAAANYVFFEGPEGLFEDCVKRGILIRSCSNYEGLREGAYRVAVKRHEDNEKLIGVLGRVLADRGTQKRETSEGRE